MREYYEAMKEYIDDICFLNTKISYYISDLRDAVTAKGKLL